MVTIDASTSGMTTAGSPPGTKDRFSKLRAALQTDIGKIPARYLALFYGDTGSGKTVYALAHANQLTEGRILYVDTGQGYLSVRNHPKLLAELAPKITVLPYKGENDLLLMAEAIRARATGFDFKCVVWDEASTMLDQFTDVVTYGRSLKEEGKDPNQPVLPDFLIAGNKFRQAVDIYSQLDLVHFIMISHYRYEKTKTGLERISPAFQPKVGRDLRRPLHTIGYLENYWNRKEKKYTRSIQVHSTDTCTAKTRVGGFADTPIVNPDVFLGATLKWLKGELPTDEQDHVFDQATAVKDPEAEDNTEGVEVE